METVHLLTFHCEEEFETLRCVFTELPSKDVLDKMLDRFYDSSDLLRTGETKGPDDTKYTLERVPVGEDLWFISRNS